MLFAATRPRLTWQLRTRSLPLGERTRIMGIVNLTPDSFSDGIGAQPEVEAAVAHALRLLEEGADLLDLGGESTRPGAIAITAAEEQGRLLPVLEEIRRARPGAILSVDTYHATTARAAVAAGAEIINDVSGLQWDPAMAPAVAELGCGLVLMHTRGTPQTWGALPALQVAEVAPLVVGELRERMVAATGAGIQPDRIVLDPGFGFGKMGAANYALLGGLPELLALGRPTLVGISRKGFLGETVADALGLAEPLRAGARLHPTLAANTAAILGGAHLLRVHDVGPAREAAAIADALLLSDAGPAARQGRP